MPQWKRDPGNKRYKAALARAIAEKGLPADWCKIVPQATDEEIEAIGRKLPLRPTTAVWRKKMMGKEAFLAANYNLDYANEELGGPDWVDKY